MENDFSAIKSLNELKNLLDSGAITQEEYEVLKRKVIFGNNPAPPSIESKNPSVGNSTLPPVVPVPPAASPNWGTPLSSQDIRPVSPIYTPDNRPQITPGQIPGNHGNFSPDNQPVNQNTEIPPSGYSSTTVQERINPGYTDPVGQRNQPVDQVYTRVEEPGPVPVKQKDWLLTILITLGVLLLLGLIGYNLFSDDESEKLTSTSGPETEEVTTQETPVPVTDSSATQSTRSDRIEGAAEPTTTTETSTSPKPATSSAEGASNPAAPTISNEEVVSRVRDRLDSYYDDIKSAPFSAQRHFAPNVERYYSLINTNPNAINDNINSYHFDEFQNSESSIEDGSMKLENSGPNGFEVTYIENGKAFRKSKNQRQETKAKVRAKFDSNFKMTYFRQEQLLENKFSDE